MLASGSGHLPRDTFQKDVRDGLGAEPGDELGTGMTATTSPRRRR